MMLCFTYHVLFIISIYYVIFCRFGYCYDWGLEMSDQIVRCLRILQCLPRYPRQLTAQQLQDRVRDAGYNFGLRTIQRDLKLLGDVFFDIDCVRNSDRSLGWFWKENAAVINLTGLTIDQALALSLVEKYLTPLFPSTTLDELKPFFAQGHATLNDNENNPLAKWLDKVAIELPSQPFLPPQVSVDIYNTINRALFSEYQLSIEYQRADGILNTYRVNPLGLVLRGNITYLIASKIDSDEIRMFALQRMRSASQIDRASTRPINFTLQAFLDEGHLGFQFTHGGTIQTIRLVAKFDTDLIKHLMETPLSRDQQVEPLGNGLFKLSASVRETEQLYWWLLTCSYHVEVLEPHSLRDRIKASITATAQIYD